MYLVLQSTYKQIEIGLFNSDKLISKSEIDKKEASKKLIPTLNDMLIKNNLSLKDLDFIGVNQGPSPFTTLRVVLATVNGIALSANIKLIGVDALDAYSKYIKAKYIAHNFCILFYAFSQEYYYLIEQGSTIKTGCNKIDNILPMLEPELENIAIFGNGIEHCQDKLMQLKGATIYDNQEYPDLNTIAKSALEKYSLGFYENKVEPIYLKSI